MPLIPAEPLLGGVSRQPDPVRLPSQVEESINMLPDVSVGLTKRSSQDIIREIAEVDSEITEDSFTQYFEDSEGTPYFMRIEDTTAGKQSVRIWDLTDGRTTDTLIKTPIGAAATEGYFNIPSGATARNSFRSATSADTTIITNNSVTIGDGLIFPIVTTNKAAGFFVKIEQADSDYTATITWTSTITGSSSVTATFNSPGAGSSNRGTNVVAVGLAAAFNADALIIADTALTLTVDEGTIIVELIDAGGLFDLELKINEDPVGNEKGITAINREVAEFTDLPLVWRNGDDPIKVTGTSDEDFIQYYVQFEATNPNATTNEVTKGKWSETVLSTFNVPAATIDPFSYPARLVIDRGDFDAARGYAFFLEHNTAEGAVFGSRLVGDPTIAPDPSYSGNTINDVFFYKNRLGFLSDENVILSELSEPFNFYPTTMLDVLETDPVEVSADSEAVNILLRAVSSDNRLLVFSKDAQFEMAGVPTPQTASVNHLSGYESDTNVKPVTTARSILFSSPDTDVSSRVMEFQRLDADIFTANDITLHIPNYIVGRLDGIVAHTASRTTLCWTAETDTGIMYVNNTLHQGAEKVQNAWHKWKLNSSGINLNHIMGAHFFDDEIYVTLRNTDDDSVVITKIDRSAALNEPLLDYRYALDFRQEDTDLTITPSGPNYEFPYLYCSETNHPVVVRHDAGTGETYEIDIISVVGNVVTTAEAGNFSVGMNPEFSWKPSKPVLKDENGKPILHLINNLQLQSLWLYHDSTHRYEAILSSEGRDTTSDPMIATEGAASLYNVVAIETDAYETKVGAIYRDLDLEITSNNIYPATFVNIEWHVEAGSYKG